MTRFLNVLLLVAVTCSVGSSRGVVKRSTSHDSTCLLDMKRADDDDNQHDLSKSKFINIKFSDDSFDIKMNDTNRPVWPDSTVIDINHWVLVAGETGELLSTFPFDFYSLSLLTLSQGVKHISLSVESAIACFEDASNEERLDIIASSLQQFFFNNEKLKGHVCIERQLTDFNVTGLYNFPENYYTILQDSTYLDCLMTVEGSSIESMRPNEMSHNHFQILSLVLSFLFWFSFNLLFVSFLCRNKPIVEGNKQHLTIRSDLPMGPTYCLVHWGNKCRAVGWLRCFLLLIIVGLLPYIPHTIQLFSDRKNFDQRWDALYNNEVISRAKVWTWRIIVNLVFLVYGILMISILVIPKPNWLETEFLETKMRNNFILISKECELATDLKIPNKHYSGLYGILFVMKARTKMTFTWLHWKHGWKRYWKYTKDNKYHWSLRYSVLLLLFLVGYFFCTIFNSVPLLYCILRWIQLLCRQGACQCIKLFVFLCGFIIFEITFLFKIVSFFSYVSGIIWYFTIGLLVNTGSVGPYIAALPIVIGYIFSTITDYYNGYVTLLDQVISAVDDLTKKGTVQVADERLPIFPLSSNHDPAEEVPTSPPGGGVGTGNNDEKSISPSDIQPRTDASTPSTHVTGTLHHDKAHTSSSGGPNPPTSEISATQNHSRQMVVRMDTEGLIAIEMGLFDKVVQKCRPQIYVGLIAVMRIVVFIVTVVYGYIIVKVVDDIKDLKDIVEVIASIIFASLVPLLGMGIRKIIGNEQKEKYRKSILENCIEEEATHYLVCTPDPPDV